MIKIRKNFVRDNLGAWHNINLIRSIYVGGAEECGYRVCFSHEFDKPTDKFSFGIKSIGETHKKEKDAQLQLDSLMDLLENEN